MVCQT